MKKTKMLKKNYEFKKVLSKGKYYSGQNIDAFIKDNKKNYNFLGLAISVKTAKAVKRNKIKVYIVLFLLFFKNSWQIIITYCIIDILTIMYEISRNGI